MFILDICGNITLFRLSNIPFHEVRHEQVKLHTTQVSNNLNQTDEKYAKMESMLLSCEEQNLSEVKFLVYELMTTGGDLIEQSQVICRVICHDCPSSAGLGRYLSKTVNLFDYFAPSGPDDVAISSEEMFTSALESHTLSFQADMKVVISPFRLDLMFASTTSGPGLCEHLLFKTFVALHALGLSLHASTMSNPHPVRSLGKSDAILNVIRQHKDKIVAPAIIVTVICILEELAERQRHSHVHYLAACLQILKLCDKGSDLIRVLMGSAAIDKIFLKFLTRISHDLNAVIPSALKALLDFMMEIEDIRNLGSEYLCLQLYFLYSLFEKYSGSSEVREILSRRLSSALAFDRKDDMDIETISLAGLRHVQYSGLPKEFFVKLKVDSKESVGCKSSLDIHICGPCIYECRLKRHAVSFEETSRGIEDIILIDMSLHSLIGILSSCDDGSALSDDAIEIVLERMMENEFRVDRYHHIVLL